SGAQPAATASGLFDTWSAKSPKYDARTTATKWAAYFRSPPTQLGAGTIFYLANQANPKWKEEAEPSPGEPPPAEQPLPYVDLTAEIKPREWLVLDRIPMRNVSLMSGEGGLGKSLLLMQLAGAVVHRLPWIGTVPVQQGPVLYMSCEEEADEV